MFMRWPGRGCRCRRSPGISAGTGRRSGPTCQGIVLRGNANRPGRTRSRRSPPTARPGWWRIRICGPPPCSTRCSGWGSTGRIRRSPGRCGPGGCGRRVSRAARRRAARSRSSTTRPAPRPNGTGSSCPTRPPHWDGYGSRAFLLVGSLAHSGKWRGVLCESMDQPHLVDALHRVSVDLGRPDPGVAVRPDGHRVSPGDGAGHDHVRPDRQALPGPGRGLPAAAR